VSQHLKYDSLEDVKKEVKVSVLALKGRFPCCVAIRGDHLPGDLEAAIRHQTTSAKMFADEAGLELISVQGKYEPWKAALLQAWRNQVVQTQRPGRKDYAARAARILPALTEASFLMHADPQQEWAANCGRGVSKVLGWLPLLSRLGAIKHSCDVAATTGRRSKRLRLGALQGEYVWMPEGPEVVLSALAKLCQAADILQAGLAKPPTTSHQWLQSYTQTYEELLAVGAPGLTKTSPYVLPWTFRSMAVARMRAQGINRLSLTSGFSVADLMASFPDQNEWLPRLIEHLRVQAWHQGRGSARSEVSVRDLLQMLRYKGPLELFTMDLCLAGDPALASYSPAYLKQQEAQLRQAACRYSAQTGQWPHMAVALECLATTMSKANS